MHENLIRQIVSANIPLTTLVRTLLLFPEQRSTKVSLENLNKIQSSPLGFEIKKIMFYLDKHPRLHTQWVSKDDDSLVWDFRGFNTSDKAKELEETLNMLGIKNWDLETITTLKPGKYKIL
jgi:hypothetical protein